MVEDLGNLCVFPGLVDINVSCTSVGVSSVTFQASSGGVTTIATSDTIIGDLFTDVARLLVLHDSNLDQALEGPSDIFAYKSSLVPQGPNPQVLQNIPEALRILNGVPLIIHPELATLTKMLQATPFRMIEPEQRVFTGKILIEKEIPVVASRFCLDSSEEEDWDIDKSESGSEDFGPEIQIQGVDGEEKSTAILVTEFDAMHLTVPEVEIDKEKKRVSLPNLFCDVNSLMVPVKVSPRHHSVQCFGTKRAIPIQDIPFIQKGIVVERAYHDHISNFPVEWETAAVRKVLSVSASCRVHFANVCSSEAIELINSYKEVCKVTCETSLPYLYFSESDVKPGDTRYKLNPPIRDYQNNKNLWQLVKNCSIDCVSSYHQPVAPAFKIIGDFKRAVNGVISVGFALQALWTRLRTQITIEQENMYLVLLGLLLSTNPAKVINLQEKGGIMKGKHADFVIWDPDTKNKISTTNDRYPDMSPFIGEELYGTIHRTYLRGKLVYSANGAVSSGTILQTSKTLV